MTCWPSEARLASFIAIAKNDVPVAHWFRLSRSLNRRSGAIALISWSGSMFEYLMPLLVMRSLPFTLLEQTYLSVVDRHEGYARARGRAPGGRVRAPTTCGIVIRRISTARSASPTWRSSADWAGTW
jgi:hypothetical protein